MRKKKKRSILGFFLCLLCFLHFVHLTMRFRTKKKYGLHKGPETEAVSRGLNVRRQVAPPGSADQTDLGKERILHATLLKNGKMPIPQTFSQVNHCKGVNNAAEYKSVRQFVSACVYTYIYIFLKRQPEQSF